MYNYVYVLCRLMGSMATSRQNQAAARQVSPSLKQLLSVVCLLLLLFVYFIVLLFVSSLFLFV